MKRVVVKAPGKLMLLGEHAVIYGYPCLVTAVNKYLTVILEEKDGESDLLITPQATNQTFIKTALTLFREVYPSKKRYIIQTESELGVYGLGSSGATVVAVITALAKIQEVKLTQEELFKLCYKAVLRVQKTGSGFDVAASIYGGIIYFDGKTKKSEVVTQDTLPIIVGYTGTKADTVTIVNQVRTYYKQRRKETEHIFAEIALCTKKAKIAIREKNWLTLGNLMNKNHALLRTLHVSTPRLDTLVKVALAAGAEGAKLSGAGGGDCMIALVSSEKRSAVVEAIKQNGGEVVNCQTSAQGVCVL